MVLLNAIHALTMVCRSSQDMFSNFKVTKMTELTLGGNAALSDVHRLSWNTGYGGEGKCVCVCGYTI